MGIETHPSEEGIREYNQSWKEAQIINDAYNKAEITSEEASNTPYEDLLPRIIHISVFIELHSDKRAGLSEGEALMRILNQEDSNTKKSTLNLLVENNIHPAIAMQDGFHTDPKMIEAFREMNRLGIKPTMWIVLNDELGYWTNKGNVKETIEKTKLALEWAKQNNIEVNKIGLDYEPSIQILKSLMNQNVKGLISGLKEYNKDVQQQSKMIGDPKEYINDAILEIKKKYNVRIETYVGRNPLRFISNLIGITMPSSKLTKRVPMVYTSSSNGDTGVINTLENHDIPALGIVGDDPLNTPGRELWEGKTGEKLPEIHLTDEQLEAVFSRIFDTKTPFRTHNVFALDDVSSLAKIINARKKTLGIK